MKKTKNNVYSTKWFQIGTSISVEVHGQQRMAEESKKYDQAMATEAYCKNKELLTICLKEEEKRGVVKSIVVPHGVLL